MIYDSKKTTWLINEKILFHIYINIQKKNTNHIIGDNITIFIYVMFMLLVSLLHYYIYNKSHFVLSQTSSHSSSLQEEEESRPYKVSLDVHTGWMHGVEGKPRSCSQWMDPKVTLTRPTTDIWWMTTHIYFHVVYTPKARDEKLSSSSQHCNVFSNQQTLFLIPALHHSKLK